MKKNITKKQTRGKEPVDSGAAYFALGVLSPLRACESCNRRAASVRVLCKLHLLHSVNFGKCKCWSWRSNH